MIRSRAASKSAAVITLPVVAHREDCRLIRQVGQVRPGEAGRSPRDRAEVHVRGQLLAAAVHGEDRGPLVHVGQRDRDLPVEPAGTQQGRVEYLRPVGRGQHHDAHGRVEAVHLGEQLVQGLLPLVVGDDRARSCPALPDRVDLVDEDDRGGPLARLGEQVADPGGADADEHLDEAGAGRREERHVRLAGDGPGEQGLAGSRRADHEHAARHDGPGPAVALRRAQEVDDLADL